MSDDAVREIVCGQCHVSPERGFEREGEVWAACPRCGQEDRVADIQREAAEHYATKSIGEMLRNAVKGSTSMSVKSAPKRLYRWITI